MPILEILLAFGLGMAGWYAFDEWQFRRRVRFCSEWEPDDDDFGDECDPDELGTTLRGKGEAAAPGLIAQKETGRAALSRPVFYAN